MKISVIIPSYHPQQHTLECLDSLRQQTLSPELFEVLVVLNGEREPYEEFLQQAMPTNGRLLYSPVASACSSRNMGIDNGVIRSELFVGTGPEQELDFFQYG